MGGVEVWLYPFLTLALDGGGWSVPCPGGSRGMALPILNLGTRWGWLVSAMS